MVLILCSMAMAMISFHNALHQASLVSRVSTQTTQVMKVSVPCLGYKMGTTRDLKGSHVEFKLQACDCRLHCLSMQCTAAYI